MKQGKRGDRQALKSRNINRQNPSFPNLFGSVLPGHLHPVILAE